MRSISRKEWEGSTGCDFHGQKKQPVSDVWSFRMSFWSDAKVLVTGAHGFTGSHLCRELVRQEAKVTAFVKNGGVLSNLGDLRKHITLVSGDITDITSLLAAMEGIDYVFN